MGFWGVAFAREELESGYGGVVGDGSWVVGFDGVDAEAGAGGVGDLFGGEEGPERGGDEVRGEDHVERGGGRAELDVESAVVGVGAWAEGCEEEGVEDEAAEVEVAHWGAGLVLEEAAMVGGRDLRKDGGAIDASLDEAGGEVVGGRGYVVGWVVVEEGIAEVGGFFDAGSAEFGFGPTELVSVLDGFVGPCSAVLRLQFRVDEMLCASPPETRDLPGYKPCVEICALHDHVQELGDVHGAVRSCRWLP